ncbi:8642_t:CDS:2 [Paraglomus occultum]|uniref:8642_t:CDS:1 n=1 Tax=Paraglomus occultum TaxID=144539 RepID=A0A9N9A286_9GLOM|nr:8642_t:CDS:2 [Paraglomus occultum]
MTSKPSGKMIFTDEKSDISAESVQQFLAEKRAQREAIIAERRKLAEENLATKIQSDEVITISAEIRREKRRFLKPPE